MGIWLAAHLALDPRGGRGRFHAGTLPDAVVKPGNINFKKQLESGKNIFSCSGKYCECRYLRRETAPAEVAARLGRTWWRDVPLRLRTQSCCDLLLGRLNRTADDGSLLETGTG